MHCKSGADRAGLMGGDKFIKINQESAYKITQDEVFDKLRGPKGSSVDITIQRIGLENPFEVTLIRDKIHIPILIYTNTLTYTTLKQNGMNILW